jgi:CBS domain-containing protein
MKLWRVRDVMTHDVATVREETPYREIVDILTARRVSAVPVVDDFGHVLGVVSEADLLHKIEIAGEPQEHHIFEGRRRRVSRFKAGGLVAKDLMTTPPVTTLPSTAVAAAARLMEHEKVKRLPVIDDLGRLVGIVSRVDLLNVYLRSDEDIRHDVVDGVLRRVLWLEPGLVRVEVTGGVVKLIGQLDRRSTAMLAVRLAQGVAGVVDVVDELGFDFDDTVLADLNAGPPYETSSRSPFGAHR